MAAHINRIAPELLKQILQLATTQLPFVVNISEGNIKAGLREYANVLLVCKWWNETLGKQSEFNLVGLKMMDKFYEALPNFAKSVKVLRIDTYGDREIKMDKSEMNRAGFLVGAFLARCVNIDTLSIRLVDFEIWYKLFDSFSGRRRLNMPRKVAYLAKLKVLDVESDRFPSPFARMMGLESDGFPTEALELFLSEVPQIHTLILPVTRRSGSQGRGVKLAKPLRLQHFTIGNIVVPPENLEHPSEWNFHQSILDSSSESLTSLEIKLLTIHEPYPKELLQQTYAEDNDKVFQHLFSAESYDHYLNDILRPLAPHLRRLKITGTHRCTEGLSIMLALQSPDGKSSVRSTYVLGPAFFEPSLSLMTSLHYLYLPADFFPSFTFLYHLNDLRELDIGWELCPSDDAPEPKMKANWALQTWRELINALLQKNRRVHVEIRVLVGQSQYFGSEIEKVSTKLGIGNAEDSLDFWASFCDKTGFELYREKLFVSEEEED